MAGGGGETKETTALLPRFLPPAWPGLVFPGSSWTAGLSGSYVCRPDLACVLGRCCLCACHWPPEPSCSPGSVTLKMMSAYWLLIKLWTELDIVLHTCNPRTLEVEAKGSLQIQG